MIMREQIRLSPPSLTAPSNSMKRRTIRSISNAVIESAHCEHVDLVDCSEFSSDEMTCMLTATGMTCCVCTATLRQMNEWKVFGAQRPKSFTRRSSRQTSSRFLPHYDYRR
ncbi:hypothetical protein PRIPAC_77263 [Pristionchus pacificus]|uniref:Uncharacterized protein n=1 Tax=Pristionchus pacificus TaxID=54126 RepID=A0A2A6C2T1_PRIPA|nr:hypothetical protein PRIPAC_77263 [Pristionchus pacificus]|eukprot:PDM72475.1 hypothetical protein PRIPAC_38909 [Pristionchus pacificus]